MLARQPSDARLIAVGWAITSLEGTPFFVPFEPLFAATLRFKGEVDCCA